MLKRIPRRNHITPVLRALHWLRIHDIFFYFFWLLTHKAVTNTAPEYLCDLIRLNVKSTTIRTRASFDPCLLCGPPFSKTCANSFFDRSFVYAAPTLWNALDLDIRLLPFDAFKKRVKTHLYLKCFLVDSYCIYIIFMFLQCVSTVIIVYIIISPLNSYIYIHWILDYKYYYYYKIKKNIKHEAGEIITKTNAGRIETIMTKFGSMGDTTLYLEEQNKKQLNQIIKMKPIAGVI